MFGSVLSLSPVVMAVMTLVVGGAMLLLGLNLTNISPKLNGLALALPTGKWFAQEELEVLQHSVRGTKKYFGAFLSGALTFFVPCGFTFAMQLYAMQTGSFFIGGLVMLLFAVGTLPGLLGIGSLTSAFKGKVAQTAYKVIGVLVILLGLYNIANSYGVITFGSGNSGQPSAAVSREVIDLVYTTSGLQPSVVELEVEKDYTLKIAVETTVYGCMSTIYLAGLNTNMQTLSKGNLITFDVSPTKAGTYEFRCAMGIPHGTNVVVK
jgi:sulfite exporter TauE/SafE